VNLALPSQTPYKLNEKELEELKNQINDLMERGNIKPNKWPYRTLIFFMDKKYDKLGMCIDYYFFNKITIKIYFCFELMII
jgi:hypothetical protein